MATARINSRRKGKACACGCGTEIPDLRTDGKPQRYVHGHGHTKPLEDLMREEDRGWGTACWIWQGGSNHNGYGRCRWNGRMRPAHAMMYEQAGGTIPQGMQLDHLCCVPACVNPEHLEPVTAAENTRRSRAAKLTAADVAEIRAIHARALAASPPLSNGRPRKNVRGGVALREELGQRYGVTRDTIKHVWRGSTWQL